MSFRAHISMPFLILFLSSCAKTIKMTPVAEAERTGIVGRAGVMVALPKTLVTVKVPVKRKVTTEGKYRELAMAFIGLKSHENSGPEYSIGDVSFGVLGKRDERQTYWAEFGGGAFTNNEATLTINEEGVMTAGSSSQDNKTFDFIASSIETGGKIAGTLAKGVGAALEGENPKRGELARQFLRYRKGGVWVKNNPQRVTAIVELVAADEAKRAKLLSDNAHPEAYEEWRYISDEFYKLLKDANRIEDLSQALDQAKRMALGTAEARAAAIADVKNELDGLLKQFIGAQEEKIWPAQWTIEPRDYTDVENAPGDSFPLFYIVKVGRGAGLHNVFDGAVPPMPGNFKSPAVTKHGENVVVELNGKKPAGAGVYSRLERNSKARSFRYRVPAPTKVIVLRGGVQIADYDTRIAQYGRLAFLPRSTGSATTKWDITLDPVTGGLTKITSSNKAFDPNLVKQIGSGTNELLTGVAARNSRDEELLAAQREAALLKARKDAMDLRKALGEAQPQ